MQTYRIHWRDTRPGSRKVGSSNTVAASSVGEAIATWESQWGIADREITEVWKRVATQKPSLHVEE